MKSTQREKSSEKQSNEEQLKKEQQSYQITPNQFQVCARARVCVKKEKITKGSSNQRWNINHILNDHK
jgi:hypothetical protein